VCACAYEYAYVCMYLCGREKKTINRAERDCCQVDTHFRIVHVCVCVFAHMNECMYGTYVIHEAMKGHTR